MGQLEVERPAPGGNKWTLQIATDRSFQEVVFEEHDCLYNFYNAIPPLEDANRFYWRVQEHTTDGKQRWSTARSFSIASDAQIWDRSQLLNKSLWPRSHPRILWNQDSWKEIKQLKDNDPFSTEIFDQIIGTAEATLRQSWWKNFPRTDSDPSLSYFEISKNVLLVGLAHKLTGENRYRGHKERMLQIASWEPGSGYSSPEGMPPTRQKWSTHLNEELALYYDWFYHDLSSSERAIFIGSLRWRLKHTLWSFIFYHDKGLTVRGGNLQVRGSSHAFQNAMVSLTGCLAVWDELPEAEKGLEYLLNYLVGVTTPFGSVEAHNEGPGYGNGKTTWLADAVWSVKTALPHTNIEKLPQIEGLIEFFNYLTPVGMTRSSFGNRGFNESDWVGRRYSGNILLGYLTGSQQAIGNAVASRKRLEEIDKAAKIYTPWTGYVLPYYANRPESAIEARSVRIWPIAGWVSAGSIPPSQYRKWKQNVGLIFTARPHGSYSHAFGSDNSFDLFAYGQVLAHGGGGTGNKDQFADSSMSHNTVLIDGRGQQSSQESIPWSARLAAFREESSFVYIAGDATPAYGAKSKLVYFLRHVLFIRGQYFVIYDDLASEAENGSTFQWLYHLNQEANLKINDNTSFDLAVNDVHLSVKHIAHTSALEIENRPGDEGRVNPMTDEKYTFASARKRGSRVTEDMRYAQHIWVSTRTRSSKHNFLAVLYPTKEGQKAVRIEGISDHAVAVTTSDGIRDVIVFGESEFEATFRVDIRSIRESALRYH
jgi:hypothetical protein